MVLPFYILLIVRINGDVSCSGVLGTIFIGLQGGFYTLKESGLYNNSYLLFYYIFCLLALLLPEGWILMLLSLLNQCMTSLTPLAIFGFAPLLLFSAAQTFHLKQSSAGYLCFTDSIAELRTFCKMGTSDLANIFGDMLTLPVDSSSFPSCCSLSSQLWSIVFF